MEANKILELAEKYRDYTAAGLGEMVKISSYSGEEKEVIHKIKEMCEAAGFDEVRVDGLGSLVARIGNGPKILAIDAHIDTVETGDLKQWEFDPFSGEVKDGYVLGRGTVDQEGGAASMITAGRILKELNYDGEYTIYFTFTVMEEDCDGLCWIYLIEEEKIKPDFAVITEPTNLQIYRGHRGRMEIKLHFTGLSAHGSMPERGDNAIYKASRAALAMEELNEELSSDPFLGKGTIVVSEITSSAPSLCAVADGASLHLDRRLTWGETKESALKEIRDKIGPEGQIEVPVYSRESYKGTVYQQEKYFPTWKFEEDHPLVQAGVEAYKSLFEKDPVVDKWTFSTNGVAISGRYGIPAIGFGPGNEIYAHAPNEKVPVDDLVKASAFYAMLPYILKSE
jgi:putative selenium metabolism hydrolase